MASACGSCDNAKATLSSLPCEIRLMIYDELLGHRRISLKRDLSDVGASSTHTSFVLLAINRQLRNEVLGHVQSKAPTFELSIHDAPFFPLPGYVKSLKLHGIVFDPYHIERDGLADDGEAPILTNGNERSIEKFGIRWDEHRVEKITLDCRIEKSNPEGWSENPTDLVLASLGRFAECRVRLRGKKTWNPEDKDNHLKAYKRAKRQILESLLIENVTIESHTQDEYSRGLVRMWYSDGTRMFLENST